MTFHTIKQRLRSIQKALYLRDLQTRRNKYTISSAWRKKAETSPKIKTFIKRLRHIARLRPKIGQSFKLNPNQKDVKMNTPISLTYVNPKPLVTVKAKDNFPMPSNQAQMSFRGQLDSTERREIRTYPTVYWFPSKLRNLSKPSLNVLEKDAKWE